MNDEPSKPCLIRVVSTDEDWIAANWLMIRHRWLWRRLIFAFVLLWLIYGGLMVAINTWSSGWSFDAALLMVASTLGVSALVTLILIGMALINVPRQVRKMRADVARLSTGADIEIHPDRIRFANGVSSATLGWEQFKRWHENTRIMALMITEREFLVLPKNQVDADVIAQVRDHLIVAKVERGLT